MHPFFSKYGNMAVDTTVGTGLLPSVVLAQAALESGYGKSQLAAKYNNLFGIKAAPGEKDVVRMATSEAKPDGTLYRITAAFRVYASAADSFLHRLNFLKKYKRYKPVFEAPTFVAQAQALQASGYATDPSYARKLIAIIRDNGLEAFDEDAKKKAGLDARSLRSAAYFSPTPDTTPTDTENPS